MGDSETGQVSADAARIYEDFYRPALFEQWPPLVIEAARIQIGHRVLDVACGTGVLTRAVAKRVGSEGLAVGIDNNAGMLDVAREKAPEIEWQQASAEALPLEDDSFDCVVSQFGLMYFEDRQCTLQEMMRVLRPGGNLAIVVWDKLENSPGHTAEDRLWQRLFGDEAADEVPDSLGDQNTLQRLFASAGICDADIRTHEGTARLPSISAWMHAGIKGWTEADEIDDAQYELLMKEAEQDLARFVTADGSVSFATPAHFVTASKPSN